MYVCICICTVCARVCMCASVCIQYVQGYVCVHLYVYSMCTGIYVCICVYTGCARVRMCASVCIQYYVPGYECVHLYVHVYIVHLYAYRMCMGTEGPYWRCLIHCSCRYRWFDLSEVSAVNYTWVFWRGASALDHCNLSSCIFVLNLHSHTAKHGGTHPSSLHMGGEGRKTAKFKATPVYARSSRPARHKDGLSQTKWNKTNRKQHCTHKSKTELNLTQRKRHF